MRVHLGGHLSWYDRHRRAWFELELSEAIPLSQLVQRLGLPPGEIALVVVNKRVVTWPDIRLSNDDQLELYAPIGGGSQ
jgi:sulfur carrier protein ThiS